MNTAIIEPPKESPDRLVFRPLPASVIDFESFAWLLEPIPLFTDAFDKRTPRPPPQIATQDTTDYMWYVTQLVIKNDENEGNQTSAKFNLRLHKIGDVGVVYADGKVQSVHRGGNQVDIPLNLDCTSKVNNDISDINRDVYLNDKNITHTHIGWQVNIGLVDEKKCYFDPSTHCTLPWKKLSSESSSTITDQDIFCQRTLLNMQKKYTNLTTQLPVQAGLVWYTFHFTLPKEYYDITHTEDTLPPIALDLTSMTKELATRPTDPRARNDQDYAGWYNPHTKCRVGYEMPSQQYYHIPLEWIKRDGDHKNCVVLFEEWGGDPRGIRIVQRVT
ncbi:5947_t:CDS:2, partial [Racocetra fulgida]